MNTVFQEREKENAVNNPTLYLETQIYMESSSSPVMLGILSTFDSSSSKNTGL
jgi:hypothetical protein